MRVLASGHTAARTTSPFLLCAQERPSSFCQALERRLPSAYVYLTSPHKVFFRLISLFLHLLHALLSGRGFQRLNLPTPGFLTRLSLSLYAPVGLSLMPVLPIAASGEIFRRILVFLTADCEKVVKC
ncbi:hypothetical protein MPTK1_5g18120 [Marchantia polymorpha subsp. ruderalis]|uniref:Transmembrane protein n=2 Tax=Marchantia polymorpha TaxID=3197 RepID=A0AAF6BJL0_MARPO|nr:hypothetical protein MARPO_0084s0059 [Marchantia polymorpha]BBN12194.1 hypothetical protein Mp_5g18120 [Marchantia polymorpha subsp. ruderalis]|eukprot:PTQ33980.1 hypothetical protein MARPO_0084s0059 [Marchantia polymorpha]